jgi:hypothetical protein
VLGGIDDAVDPLSVDVLIACMPVPGSHHFLRSLRIHHVGTQDVLPTVDDWRSLM